MDVWQIALILLAALAAGPCALVLGAVLLRRSGLAFGVADRSPTPPPPPTAGTSKTPAEIAELAGELAAVRAEWKAHQKQLDAYLDAFEDLEESVERRRRRSAASRSKIEAAQQQQEEQVPMNPREEARMRARARGFRV